MTGRIIPLQGDRHRQIQALLPWYAAGSLDDDEQSAVQAHLDTCPECQADLRSERRMVAEMAEAIADDGESSVEAERGWWRMRRRIEQGREARGRFTGWLAPLARAGGRRRPDAPWLGWAVAGQACLLLILGGVVWQTTQPARYHALSAPPAGPPGAIVVIFRPEMTEAELRGILRDSHARLVDGPTAADAYVLGVPAKERPRALALLRGRPQVVLAEPVDGGAPR